MSSTPKCPRPDPAVKQCCRDRDFYLRLSRFCYDNHMNTYFDDINQTWDKPAEEKLAARVESLTKELMDVKMDARRWQALCSEYRSMLRKKGVSLEELNSVF